MGVTVQTGVVKLPFHCSARASCSPELLMKPPTAEQYIGDGHDTPNKELPVAPLGLGWTVHPDDATAGLAPALAGTKLKSRVASRPPVLRRRQRTLPRRQFRLTPIDHLPGTPTSYGCLWFDC
jgi:hypothetical protein